MIFQVLKNKNFMLISIPFGIYWGCNIAMCAVMSPLMKGYGYGPTVTSGLALFYLIGSVLGMTTFGLFLDRTHKFLLSLRLITILATLAFILGMIVLPLGLPIPVVAVGFYAGFCIMGTIPIGVSFTAEVTYPLEDSLVNGLL